MDEILPFAKINPDEQFATFGTPFSAAPSPETLTVPVPETANQESFGELYGRARQEEHIDALLSRKKSFPPTPGYEISKENFKAHVDKFQDQALRDYVSGAQSDEELAFRSANAAQTEENLKVLGQNGLKGTTAYLLAAMFDPTEIAAITAGTWGAGTIPSLIARAGKGTVDAIKFAEAAAAARKASSIARATKRGAVIGAAQGAVFEGARTILSPEKTGEDLIENIAIGGALGATTDAALTAFSKVRRFGEYKRLINSGEQLTPEQMVKFADFLDNDFKRAERAANTGIPAENIKDDLSGFVAGREYKFTVPDEYNDVPVVLGKTDRVNDAGRPVAAHIKYRADGSVEEIRLDIDAIKAQYRERTRDMIENDPRLADLKALVKNEDDYVEFVYNHEAAHVRQGQRPGESDKDYEKRINHEAVRRMKENRQDFDLDQMNLRTKPGMDDVTIDLINDAAYKASEFASMKSELSQLQNALKKAKTKAGKEKIKGQINGLEARIQSLSDEIDAQKALINQQEGVPTAPVQPLATDNPDLYKDAPYQRGWRMFGLRGLISSVAKAMESPVGLTRTVAQRLGLNSAGNKDGSAVPFDALSFQNFYQASSSGRLYTVIKKNRDAWRERTGNDDLRIFNEEVTRAARDPLYSTDENVRAVAAQLRKEFDKALQDAQYYKVRGFVEWDDQKKVWKRTVGQENYVPRIHDDRKFMQLLDEIGEGNVVKLVAKAIKNKQEDIDDDLLQQIAQGYVAGIKKRVAMKQLPDGTVVRMGIREDTLTEVEEGLMERYNDAQKVADIMEDIQRALPSLSGKEGIGRARQRLELDEMASLNVNGREVRFDEMLMNDFEDLHQMYMFQMGGALGLARNGIDQAGGTSFQSVLNAITKEGQRLGHNVERELAALQFMYDGITGQLAHQNGIGETGEKVLRRVRQWNFMTYMGGGGMAAAIEAPNVLIEHTAFALAKGLPRLKDIIRKMETGQLDDALFREMQQFTGLGTDMITGRVRINYDDFDSAYLKADHTMVDRVLEKGQHGVAVASGMLPLTAMLRRADSMFYALDWFGAAQEFKKTGKFKAPFSDIKMEQLGISKADGEKLAKAILRHSEVDQDGKLVTLHLDKWDGDEGRYLQELFSTTAYRHGTSAVQETNLGSVMRFLRTPIGKTVAQFLTYPLAATEQQFQRLGTRMVNGDAARVSGLLMGSAMMGALVYMTRTYMNSMGRSEKDKYEYLKKQFTPEAIAAGAIQYVGAGSVFTLISQRMSGDNRIISNPTVELFNGFYKGGAGMIDHAINGGKPSEAEIRKMLKLAPFTTLPGVAQGVNALSNYLEDNRLD